MVMFFFSVLFMYRFHAGDFYRPTTPDEHHQAARTMRRTMRRRRSVIIITVIPSALCEQRQHIIRSASLMDTPNRPNHDAVTTGNRGNHGATRPQYRFIPNDQIGYHTSIYYNKSEWLYHVFRLVLVTLSHKTMKYKSCWSEIVDTDKYSRGTGHGTIYFINSISVPITYFDSTVSTYTFF